MVKNNFKIISVIGAGTMGVGIAQVFMLSTAEKVHLIDISKKALENAKKKLITYTDKLKAKNFFHQNGEAENILNKLNISTHLDEYVFNSD